MTASCKHRQSSKSNQEVPLEMVSHLRGTLCLAIRSRQGGYHRNLVVFANRTAERKQASRGRSFHVAENSNLKHQQRLPLPRALRVGPTGPSSESSSKLIALLTDDPVDCEG